MSQVITYMLEVEIDGEYFPTYILASKRDAVQFKPFLSRAIANINGMALAWAEMAIENANHSGKPVSVREFANQTCIPPELRQLAAHVAELMAKHVYACIWAEECDGDYPVMPVSEWHVSHIRMFTDGLYEGVLSLKELL